MAEDWADAKAHKMVVAWKIAGEHIDQRPSLAALLREERAGLLAEVRREIEELMGGERDRLVSGDYLLARLEALR